MFHRHLTIPIKEALEDTPVIVLNGARQVGKSMLCQMLIKEGVFHAQMITLDDPTILAAAKKDPLGFLEGLSKHLVIDEVQKAPELLLSIKKIIDEDRLERRIILTGSANVMTLPKIADSLAGRIEIHHLWPLSLLELNADQSDFFEILLSTEASGYNHKTSWEDIVLKIVEGGYPEITKRKTATRKKKWFESYISSILQKDIRELANIEGLNQIPNVLHLIATRVGSTINLSDISRLSGIKNTTLQRYMILLEHVFLIIKIPAWTPNSESQYVKSPKIFLNDTGLLCHLRGESADSLLANKSKTGSFLENFVVIEILKQLSWSSDELKAYHFSMHQGSEVDLVLEDKKGQLYGIEIKSTSTLKEQDFKGLKHLEKLSGSLFKKGIILYNGEHMIKGFGGKNLYAVPLSALWRKIED